MGIERFTPEYIIDVLKEVEMGASISAVCRRHGVPHVQYYKWRAQYGGMEAEELTRLRKLQAENEQLKKLLGEAHLEIAMLRQRSERTLRISESSS